MPSLSGYIEIASQKTLLYFSKENLKVQNLFIFTCYIQNF